MTHNTPIIKNQGTGKIRIHLMSPVSPMECKHRQNRNRKKWFLLHFSRKTQKPKAIEKMNRKMKFIFISIATDFWPVFGFEFYPFYNRIGHLKNRKTHDRFFIRFWHSVVFNSTERELEQVTCSRNKTVSDSLSCGKTCTFSLRYSRSLFVSNRWMIPCGGSTRVQSRKDFRSELKRHNRASRK